METFINLNSYVGFMTKLGGISWNKGLRYTKEQKEKYSKMGRPAGFISEKRVKYITKKCKNCFTSFSVPPCRENTAFFCSIKCIHIGRKQSLEQVQKSLKLRLINKQMSIKETSFLELLNTLNLPYSFVGDGKLLIERYCPDFIHNTKKKIIELCSYSNKKIKNKLEIYNKNGYEVLFIFNNSKNKFQVKTIKKIIDFTNN